MNDFDWKYYINHYPDLQEAGINTRDQAYRHYINHGKIEGRIFKKPLFIKLPTIQIIDLTTEITLDKEKFYSSNITLVRKDGKIYSIIRYVNYLKDIYTPNICRSINKLIIFDRNWNELESRFIEHSDMEKSLTNYIGIEDVKLFYFNKNLYYIGNFINKLSQISINKFDLTTLNVNVIKGISIKPVHEKNWCLFEKDRQIMLVYTWSPLMICKIIDNSLVPIFKMENDKFGLRGSTNGCRIPQGVIFITHTNNNGNYLHCFALICDDYKIYFSDYFKFENHNVEFCLGLILLHKDLVISYSINDKLTKIAKIKLNEVVNLLNNYPRLNNLLKNSPISMIN